jgi:CRISPR-associated protein Csb1
MAETAIPSLTFDQLRDAVAGDTAAVRLVMKLQPAGGPEDKVFPPTYAGGVYAFEERRIGEQTARVVLLDSVQSQANRLELALLQAYRDRKIKFPLLSVDFSGKVPNYDRLSTLEAPHRIADAIFRDSLHDEVPFRDSVLGTRFASASVANATALFETCPTALLFGVWDSTGAAGGRGAKFARAVVSEIIGINAVAGVRTSSRVDPLAIEKCPLYQATDGSWTVMETDAMKDDAGKPIPFKRKKSDKGKPSEINHGNVTPDIVMDEKSGEPISGGVTMSHAVQTTVLSLPALRRLRFPDEKGESSTERDNAARTALAALALAAIVHQRKQGYFLRSRCDLVPREEAAFELVRTASDAAKFTLGLNAADAIFAKAVDDAKAAKLPSWTEDEVLLKPKQALVDLVNQSRELAARDEGED